MNIGWNFPKNNFGDTIGISDSGIETFKGNLFGSLAREICQNSLDARVNMNEPVRVEFALDLIDTQSMIGYKELYEAIQLCRNNKVQSQKTINFLDKAKEICLNDQIRVLRISDYNTTGLQGSKAEEGENTPWFDLVKSSGVSNKSGALGGSYGIGKFAPFACSDLRTVFYSTLDIEQVRAYQGIAKLITFTYPTWDSKEKTQGKGYYGDKKYNTPIFNEIPMCNYKRLVPGTDVFIIGFIENSQWRDEVVKEILTGYLISILNNDLEIVVDGFLINKDNIQNVLDMYKQQIEEVYNYYEALVSPDKHLIHYDIEGLGELELHVLIKPGFHRKALMARSNGMKIFDKNRISSSIPFAAVCILKDLELNEFFREMENPEHNAWEIDRHSKPARAKKVQRHLYRFIKDQVMELGKSAVGPEVDAIGAGEIVADLIINEGDGEKKEAILEQVNTYTAEVISKVQNIEGGKKGRESEFINQTGGEHAGTESTNEGDLENVGELGNPGSGKGNASRDSQPTMPKVQTVNNKISIVPQRIRLFLLNHKDRVYKVSFIPDRSASAAYMQVQIAGEQNSATTAINSAVNKENNPYTIQGSKIFLGDIVEAEPCEIFFTIKGEDNYSMGVQVYGYKL